MPGDDLQKWVTSSIDFYALLGLTSETCTDSELRRAYRKTALKYHPDKVGKDFDPEKYEQFQAANDILSDPELKAKYDNHRTAELQKKRANELLEGRRRQMKEDLEMRERNGVGIRTVNGVKRAREEEVEMSSELKRMKEDGRKRRLARESLMAENIRVESAASSPAPAPPASAPENLSRPTSQKSQEEDEEARIERRLREIEESKARRTAEKAERKAARKSGVFIPVDLPSVGRSGEENQAEGGEETPIKRPEIFNKRIKADDTSSASPKFSFSPHMKTTLAKSSFADTMARLKAAEEQRREEIRLEDARADVEAAAK